MLHVFFFFLENTLYNVHVYIYIYIYIEFDYTDYTRRLTVSIFTAFKIQNSVSVEGMHNRRKD